MKAEAETRVMQLLARLETPSIVRPPEARREEERFFLRASNGSQPCQHPDCRPLASITAQEFISGSEATQFVTIGYGSPRKLKHTLFL